MEATATLGRTSPRNPIFPVYVDQTTRTFRLVKADSEEMRALRGIFEKILVPLYGSQEDALKKISLAKERVCYLLYEQHFPVGVIAFKTAPSDEYQEFGVKNSIEIKSLFVVESGKNSGRGIGSVLLDKVTEEINKHKILCDSMHVTVSETKGESLAFFKRKGFRVITQWKGRYIEGVTEYLLSVATNQERDYLGERVIPEKEKEVIEPTAAAVIAKWMPKILRVIQNAHWDDIHALKLLSDGTFVSGSKDNSLRKWDKEGNVVKEVYEPEPRDFYQKERDWITAIAVLNDDYWICGDRRGRVALWNTEGDYIKDLLIKQPGRGHRSHHLNRNRINCLAPGFDKAKFSFFAGFPTMFDEYNLIEGRTVATTKVHNNDWVYCIHPLSETRNLVVVAGTVEVWEKSHGRWHYSTALFREKPKVRETRCHISALAPLESSPHHFGLGIFGGFVTVLDVSSGQIVQEWQGHKNQIWAIENISREVFASSGQDGYIKLWDTRMSECVAALGNQIGGVSALLRLSDENVLVAGASPENPLGNNIGARLLFYDLRG